MLWHFCLSWKSGANLLCDGSTYLCEYTKKTLNCLFTWVSFRLYELRLSIDTPKEKKKERKKKKRHKRKKWRRGRMENRGLGRGKEDGGGRWDRKEGEGEEIPEEEKEEARKQKKVCSHSVNSSHFLSLVGDRECGKKDIFCPAQFSSVQFSSVAQSCPTLCDPMNHSTPGLPTHHQLPEFTQTHVHRVGDDIQPSRPLSSPSPLAPNPSQHQSLFQWVNSLHEVAKVLEFQL